ncbi:MAG: GTP-binding protein [Arenicellales bacterium]|nr:GTP-binding protein [Arenicellales bacterium]|tara:strand:+ start:4366 stop:5256 length:891 start_codon:yes stop_codon:yes gene_type:complete
MTRQELLDRRALARQLSLAGRASVADVLSEADSNFKTEKPAVRIGVTGPPGAGKSTLIARLAASRLQHGERVGVLAIDPTSPLSQGSILGDRIRMDEIADDPNLYIRSMPSRHAHDGMADNITGMLAVLESHNFDNIFLETVGIGQADYSVRTLVDTVILVVVPESGDTVQAMKAGVMEMADVYAVNKADRPGAKRTVTDIQSVLALKENNPGGWRPRVLQTSSEDGDVLLLDQAITDHLNWRRDNVDLLAHRRDQARYNVEMLLNRRVGELLADAEPAQLDRPISDIYADLVGRL